MTEEWRLIPSWPLYEASSEGRIRRARPGRRTTVGLVLKPKIENNGYLRVVLYGGSQSSRRSVGVHRLVCEAFHGPPPEGTEAAHADGTRTNNRADNLSWKSRSENHCDKRRHGTSRCGEANPRSKLQASDVVEIRRLSAEGMSNIEIAALFGINPQQVSNIKRRLVWRHVP